MSLTLEAMAAADRRFRNMSERLRGLFGYNPATMDHYGIIRFYNQMISEKTTDEELCVIRNDYLAWYDKILAFFEENGYHLEKEELDHLFTIEFMNGYRCFMGIVVKPPAGTAPYEESIKAYIREHQGT